MLWNAVECCGMLWNAVEYCGLLWPTVPVKLIEPFSLFPPCFPLVSLVSLVSLVAGVGPLHSTDKCTLLEGLRESIGGQLFQPRPRVGFRGGGVVVLLLLVVVVVVVVQCRRGRAKWSDSHDGTDRHDTPPSQSV
jgi:hypothetical protein